MNSFFHLLIMVSLCAGLLVLAGCSVDTAGASAQAQPPVNRPAPRLEPAGFAYFDERAAIPDRIVIPSIELDTQVVDQGWKAEIDPTGRIFGNWDVAAYAAGWHVNSDRLGQGGNVVLSGHNNILGAVFRELDQLKAGDALTLWSGDRQYDYAVDKVVIVPERDATHEQRLENARWIGEFTDNRLTLVSCWPRDDNSHRIIVVGHHIDNAESDAPSSNADRSR